MSGDDGRDAGAIRAFWLHLVDNLFRHRVLFVIPVIVFAALGVIQTRNDPPVYESEALIRTSVNPYVGLQVLSGFGFDYRHSAAEGTIQLIEEQFTTYRFATEVTERAGLGDEIGAGWGVLSFVRDSVTLEPAGDSLIRIRGTWGDPATSLALTQGTVDAFVSFVADIASTNAAEAEDFYKSVLADATAEVAATEQAYVDYLKTLQPLGQDAALGIEEQLESELLLARVERAREAANAASSRVDLAVVATEVAESQNAGLLQVVDPAALPTSPVSTTVRDLKSVLAHLVMGVVVAAAAVLVTTAVDPAITVRSEVSTFPGVEAVTVVPPIEASTRPHRRWRARAVALRSRFFENATNSRQVSAS